MLILLPPSEGKTSPTQGPTLHESTLSFPDLNPTRERILTALIALCRRPATAKRVLGLGPAQESDITTNRDVAGAPCAPAIDIYTGVLYDALDVRSLTNAQRVRLEETVVIGSALWGLVRAGDFIPAYRLSGDTRLPRLDTLASLWREPITKTLSNTSGPILDLRSATYQYGQLPARPDVLLARVLLERDGKRTVVTHHNKATKGRVVRALMTARRRPRTLDDAIAILHDSGITCELSNSGRGTPTLDLITSHW